jgi:molybdate transport system ATP-binding protein
MTSMTSAQPADILRVQVHRHVVDAHLDIPLRGPVVTVLFGPSGAGKTTVLRAIAGLDDARGCVISLGETVWADGARNRVHSRNRQVGYLFQDHALFPHLSVSANVGFGITRGSRRERLERVTEALAMAAAEHLTARPVSTLSGGEAQRVALARALAPQPQLLLLDEPLSALDTPTRVKLRSDLRRILVTAGIPTIVVTHDRAEALALGDKVVVMINGQVRQTGEAAQVFDRPADTDVMRVVGVETALPGTVMSSAGGLTQVSMSGHVLTALDTSEGRSSDLHSGSAVLVCIRAEDVSLEVGESSTRGSQRNHVPAVVTQVQAEGALVRVGLDAGVHLTSAITRTSAQELQIAVGQSVTAVIKSTSVHLIPR